jgi:hypothetical protein
MVPCIKSSEYLCKIATGEDRVGRKGEGGERQRKQCINRVSNGVLDRNGKGMGWKWPLGKLGHLSILS